MKVLLFGTTVEGLDERLQKAPATELQLSAISTILHRRSLRVDVRSALLEVFESKCKHDGPKPSRFTASLLISFYGVATSQAMKQAEQAMMDHILRK